MSAALADAVMSAILGGQDAQHLLHAIRMGAASVDALHEALKAVLDRTDAERLRGFARELQKALERGA